MHRSLAYAGLILVIGGILLLAIPFLITATFQVSATVYLAGLLFLVGIVMLLRGATSVDPAVTTVGGFLGNPVATEVRKMTQPAVVPSTGARYRADPNEPINCRFCYTVIPAGVVDCPRCGRRRVCRSCSKPLFFIAGAVRCAPCVRDEIFCNCPRTKPVTALGPVTRRAR